MNDHPLTYIKRVHAGLGPPMTLSVVTLILVFPLNRLLPSTFRRTVKAKELGENLLQNYLSRFFFSLED